MAVSMLSKKLMSRTVAGAVIAATLLPSASLSAAQEQGAGGTARRRGKAGSSIRFEAAGFIQWKNAPIDTTKGAATEWLHISAARNSGSATGGFTIDAKPRITGKVVSVIVNGDPLVSRPPAPGKPSVAKIMCAFNYGGKDYNLQIDAIADMWKPSPTPGGKGASVRGTFHLKATETKSKAVNVADGVKQTSVTIWMK